MNVLIIEDEVLTAKRLQNLLFKYDPDIRVLAQIPSVKQSIAWLEDGEHIKPDLIFLDIHLEDDLGFRIVDHLQLTIPIVFTTAYNEYTLKAFKTNGVDYLLKPVDFAELSTAIDKFKQLHFNPGKTPDLSAITAMLYQQSRPETFKDRFMVSAGSKLFSLATKDIAYFTFEQKATFLRTFDGKRFSIDYSLDKLCQLLDPKEYFRINRSMIVSMASILSIHALSAGKIKLTLSPEFIQDALVSTDRITDFKLWLGK
jgi:DNA-binding LytR/AlgR family response regulator